MRPCKPRRIGWLPPVQCFAPQGEITSQESCISLDMLESLRLVDAQGLSQEEAAKAMDISTATLCRILGEARRRVAIALCQGHHIIIEGGNVMLNEKAGMHRCGCGPHGRMGKRQGAFADDNGYEAGNCPGRGRGRGQGMRKGRMESGQCTGDGPCRRGQPSSKSAQQPAECKGQTAN